MSDVTKSGRRTPTDLGGGGRPLEKLAYVGAVSSFIEGPTSVTVRNRSYFVMPDEEGGYKLLSAVCPHLGGSIENTGTEFRCPNHGWRFDYGGNCKNAPLEQMSSVPVLVSDGHLYADLPVDDREHVANAHSKRGLVSHCTIELHSHACLEIAYKGHSLLTDPWLAGPAFLGAWTQYPPPVVDVADLRPDAIWISHEHPDHFHEPTLELFDRSLPIFVPDFPNRRMVRRLTGMGFDNIQPVLFGETYEITDGLRLTCFETASLWNDSITLFELDGFRILNLNDAGLNRRISRLIGPVDVVASSFAGGASGYPFTWRHLSQQQKMEISERRSDGMLRMLKEAMQLYGGDFLLPYAGHFALWHPSHREFQRQIKSNTVRDVVVALEGTNVSVIDILPGEKWDVSTGTIQRSYQNRELVFDRSHQMKNLERQFDPEVFAQFHPVKPHPERDDIEAYLLRMNDIPDILFCEDLTVLLKSLAENGRGQPTSVSFQVEQGELRILGDDPDRAHHLTMEVPGGILKRIITDDLSWDEAHIGHWCRFTRSPDVFHSNFWRLLQAPYYNKPADVSPATGDIISEASIVAEIVERYGIRADRLLRRYGLYCIGCGHSNWCSISQSGTTHGVDASRIQRLAVELRQLAEV